jgi:hypothetical protein
MLPILLCSLAVGTACGLAAIKVWAIVPMTAIFCAIALVVGFSLGLTSDQIAVGLFASLISLQIAYLAGIILRGERAPRQLSKRVSARPEMLRVMQRAIAVELPDYFTLPDELTPQVRAKLVSLTSH